MLIWTYLGVKQGSCNPTKPTQTPRSSQPLEGTEIGLREMGSSNPGFGRIGRRVLSKGND